MKSFFGSAGEGAMQEYLCATNQFQRLAVLHSVVVTAVDRIAKIKTGDQILIMGCTGGVGLLAS
jgi:NADPH:quinone reductase-like Zn-dependent oxidoreductase